MKEAIKRVIGVIRQRSYILLCVDFIHLVANARLTRALGLQVFESRPPSRLGRSLRVPYINNYH